MNWPSMSFTILDFVLSLASHNRFWPQDIVRMFLQFMPASPGYMCHQAFLQLVPQPAAAICVYAQVKWSTRYEKEPFSHDGLGLSGSSEKWQGGG